MKQELMNGTPPGAIHACRFALDTERDFHPLGSLHLTYNVNKIRPYYLSTGRALFTHERASS
jgi:hypothetical protein